MRHIVRATFAGALGVLTAGLVACGASGSGFLSSDQASQLGSRLSQLASQIDSGRCSQAAGTAASFQNDVAQLPDSVSTTLRANLIQGANTIAELTPKTCTNTSTTPTTTTATQTTPTTTTTTQPTVTTSTPPPPTTTSAPPPVTVPSTPSTTTSGSGGAGVSGNSGSSTASSGGAGAGGSGNSGNGQ